MKRQMPKIDMRIKKMAANTPVHATQGKNMDLSNSSLQQARTSRGTQEQRSGLRELQQGERAEARARVAGVPANV